MREIEAGSNEAGQRADKLIMKYLDQAPVSFLYKMIRKKNITLNGKRMTGNEILKEGDRIRLYLADDTILKFQKARENKVSFPAWFPSAILYEDENVILINKPPGILSQKDSSGEPSINEYLISYLLSRKGISHEQLKTFRPSFCNRLDRNTSGILAGGKTLGGLQELSKMFRERTICKYYLALVCGTHMEDGYKKGFLRKDASNNRVLVVEEKPEEEKVRRVDGAGVGKKKKEGRQKRSGHPEASGKWEKIETSWEVLKETPEGNTLLLIHLITGKTHQIRGQMAALGHPILGDVKYGGKKRGSVEGEPRLYLHSCRLEFPEILQGLLAPLSGKCVICAPPWETRNLSTILGNMGPDKTGSNVPDTKTGSDVSEKKTGSC